MRKTAILFLAICLASIAPLAAQTVAEGEIDGAFYRIVVPDAWNGGLVIWNHGFTLSPAAPLTDEDLGPLAQLVHLAQGYAVAASSYSQNGWALFQTDADLAALVELFTDQFGLPNQVFLYGASLGGAVTASAIEGANLPNLVGAFTICGAMAGSRNWDGALDLRLLYDFVCANTPAAAIPGGARGLPANSLLTPQEVGARVNACTGVSQDPETRTKRQKRNLKKLVKLTGLPAEFLQTDMSYVTFGLRDLYARGKLNGKQGIGNAGVDYGKKKVNRKIERVKAKKKPTRRMKRNFSPAGSVGDVKIVSIHTDKDGLVLVENQSEYASVLPPENLTVGIVVEGVPSHCGFTGAELVAGWESLRSWVATGQQPTAGDLQVSCQAYEPLVGGPCRIDPNFVVPDMDGRVRPR